MALHYRASITQTTGEHWPDVALTLSTASPQIGSEVPNLSAWRIGFPAPTRQSYSIDAVQVFAEMEEAKEESDDDMGFALFDDDAPAAIPAPPARSAPAMRVRQAQVVSAGVLSATFGISGRSDIPSDEGSHKVVIAVLDFPAELEWICVPREKESVFLRVSFMMLSCRVPGIDPTYNSAK